MAEKSGWTFAFRALKHRNYRLFFAGQGLSLIGTWMSQVATSWLVYRLTGSALYLGTIGFAGQIPSLVLSPFAGVWVDRADRHRVLKMTQALSMLQSFAMAYLALTKTITIPWILALTAFQGLVNAVDIPARQSFVIHLVEDRADLANAIALNSSMFNAARLIGPSIAGLVIAAAGEGICFLIDGFSYLAVIGSLFLLHVRPSQKSGVQKNVLHDLKEGWDYVIQSPPIRSILLLLAFVSLVGVPYMVLMPVFAGNVLHGGPHTLGFLTAAVGLGALSGAINLAMRKTVLGLGKRIGMAAAAFGFGLILFGLSHYLWISLLLLFFTGFALMQEMASSNTIVQTIVDENKRGRVMSFYTMAFLGVAPFGSLFAGWLASKIGAPITVMAGGVLSIIVAGWFLSRLNALRELVRPIYVEMGILPEVARGLQAAGSLQTPPA